MISNESNFFDVEKVVSDLVANAMDHMDRRGAADIRYLMVDVYTVAAKLLDIQASVHE